jgi:UDP-N-acetylglucosamine 1-carboxyvinyltransferase
MSIIRINGGKVLEGKVPIGGAKNAALPLMVASLLTKDTLVLTNVPNLSDIVTMSHLLMQHGVSMSIDGDSFSSVSGGRSILLNAANVNNNVAPYDIVRKMRASVWVLGPLVARFGEAVVSLPGGCAIGSRPIDLHIMALKEMGAKVELRDGNICASVQGRLRGADISFDKISVGATHNAVMAATLAEGITILRNIAKEPEVKNLTDCLIMMGAKIRYLNDSTLEIDGVESLHGAHCNVIPDRIEAGTYAIAAAITDGEIELLGFTVSHMEHMLRKFSEAGVGVLETPRGIKVFRTGELKSTNVTTGAYPGFPTDMQAQFMSLMSVASGTAVITETIFENRFMHVAELSRMGADVCIHGNTAVIRGNKNLIGTDVRATDLRASVSLLLAGLVAKDVTTIHEAHHIERGYERIEEKLIECGADIDKCSVLQENLEQVEV